MGEVDGSLTASLMALPRLFLVASEGLSAGHLVACVRSACVAGDVASIVVPASTAASAIEELQSLGLAVLSDGALNASFDGMHVNGFEADIAALKSQHPRAIIGAFCGASRHQAMEAAEAGADYVALSQNTDTPMEPIIGWWADLFEIPCVAFDPVDAADLDILLPQSPDFIRPGDAMWVSPQEAARIAGELTERLKA